MTLKFKTMENFTKEDYDKMKMQQEVASKNNDYSKMIIIGSPEAISMKKYEQDNLCKHLNVETLGGIDVCSYCGKYLNKYNHEK